MNFAEEWSGDIPDAYDSSKALAEFDQQLFEYWKREEGPCHGCPNYYYKDRCHPRDGKGPADAEIMLVGRVPGAPGSLEKPRTNRKVDPEKLEQQPRFDGYPLVAFYGRHIEQMQSWQGISTMRLNFIDHERGLNLDIAEMYFTNVKKCHDVVGDDNSGARDRCSRYLEKELEIVAPDVVVTWGMDAAKGVSDILGYDRSRLPSSRMSLPAGDVHPTDSFIGYREAEPNFVTMPHWSGIRGSNYESIPGYDPAKFPDEGDIKLIYYELAGVVRHLLDQ